MSINNALPALAGAMTGHRLLALVLVHKPISAVRSGVRGQQVSVVGADEAAAQQFRQQLVAVTRPQHEELDLDPTGSGPQEEVRYMFEALAVAGGRGIVQWHVTSRQAPEMAEVDAGNPQQVMARWTGNYRRGNERTAKRHLRNARS